MCDFKEMVGGRERMTTDEKWLQVTVTFTGHSLSCNLLFHRQMVPVVSQWMVATVSCMPSCNGLHATLAQQGVAWFGKQLQA